MRKYLPLVQKYPLLGTAIGTAPYIHSLVNAAMLAEGLCSTH